MVKTKEFFTKDIVQNKLQDAREKNDVLLQVLNDNHTLEIQINHYGGVYVYFDGAVDCWSIGSKAVVERYCELYNEHFRGKKSITVNDRLKLDPEL